MARRRSSRALFAGALMLVAASIGVSGALTRDFDGDGLGDPSVLTTGGDWVVRTSSSGFASSLTEHPGAPNTPLFADFDGDGKRDFATYREWTGDWNVKLSSTNYTTSRVDQLGRSALDAHRR